MKTIKKISLILFLSLAITNAYGNDFNTNDLIHKMSNDNDVSEFCITLLKERMAINLYGDINLIKNSELLKEVAITKAKQIKIVRDKYPELLELNLSERQEVFEKVLSQSKNYRDQLKCIGMNVLRLAIAEIFVGTGAAIKWKLTKLGLCAAGSVFVDAAEEVETAGAATPAVVVEVVAESKFCMAISGALGSAQLLIIEEGVRRILFGCNDNKNYNYDNDN